MERYVVGFILSKYNSHLVALLRKNKPDYQKGLLNGIGGKIEVGETPEDAMKRGGIEEVGLDTRWERLGKMELPHVEIFIFRAFTHLIHLEEREEEKIEIHIVDSLVRRDDVMDNVSWLVPMARNISPDWKYELRLENE